MAEISFGILSSDSQRTKAAECAFHRLRDLWQDKHVKVDVKIKVYKPVVQATFFMLAIPGQLGQPAQTWSGGWMFFRCSASGAYCTFC